MEDKTPLSVADLAAAKPTWYRGITAVSVVSGLGLMAASTSWLSFQIGGVQPAVLMDVALLGWAVASVRQFSNTVFGVVRFGGKPQFVVTGGGLRFIPRGLFKITNWTTQTLESEFPGEPEQIQKTDDSEPLRTVKIRVDGETIEVPGVRPVRILTAKPVDSADPADPLNVQLGIEFSWWQRMRIVDPLVFEIELHNLDEATRQLRDIGEGILTGLVTKKTAQQLTSDFDVINVSFFEEMKNRTKKLGIEIQEIRLNPIDYGHTVASAIQKITLARAEAQQAIGLANAQRTKADADAYTTTKEGEGKAAAALAIGTAEAKVIELKGKADGTAEEERRAGRGRGVKRAAHFIGVKPEVVLQAEVAENTVGKGTIIVGNDMAAIGKAVGAGKALLNNIKTERSEDK